MPAHVKFVTAVCLALVAGCTTRPSQAPAKKADAAPAQPPIAAGPDARPPPAGPYHVLGPLRDTAAVDACAADGDCAVAPLSCCDCAHGGLGAAVATAKLAAWSSASCAPDSPACGETPTDDPTCRAVARCVNGRCRLTVSVEALSPTAPSPGTP